MAKLNIRLWFGVAIIGLLVACSGGGGGDSAAGVAPGPDAPGGPVTPPPPILPAPVGYADAAEILAFILEVNIPDDGHTVVEFQLTDGNGTAILDLDAGNLRFVLAKLQTSPLGNMTGTWQSYVNSIEEAGSVGPGTDNKLQATYERGGEFTNSGDGTYRYRFSTNVNELPADILAQAADEGLNLDYTPEVSHRVSIQFDGGPNAANPYYDFVPATGATENIAHMQIAETTNCNRCHDELGLHGGNRVKVEYCVTCHNPGSTDANSGNTVDFKVMIHKIHRGASLPSVEAGRDYILYGFRDGAHDYSHVKFPQDIRNCQNCHVGTGTNSDNYPEVLLTNQGDNWNEFPSRAACGSCHDDVDFDAHRGGQPDDSRCAGCHSNSGPAGDPAHSHALLARDESKKYRAEIVNVSSTGPGENASIDFRITDPATGELSDILNDSAWTQPGGASRLAVTVGWSTADYTNTGNESDGASTVSIDALANATPNGDGSFNVVSPIAIPDGSLAPGIAASGSGASVIEGHPAVDVSGDGVEQIPLTNVVGFFSIDEADGRASPRRESVKIEQCSSCHQNLVSHGGNRSDSVNSCVTCHNPRNTDRDVRETAFVPPTDGKDEESLHFKTMIHGIHAAGMRENPLQIVGFRGFSTHIYDEEHVQFPGKLNNCKSCHVDGGYTLPLADNVLGTTIDTGDDHSSPVDDTVISPAAAVCSSCHDDKVAKAHMENNGGSFSTTQAAIDSSEVVEQCVLCHGSGKSADIDLVHGID